MRKAIDAIYSKIYTQLEKYTLSFSFVERDPVICNDYLFVENMHVLRKDRIGVIKRIDRSMDPPGVSVIMDDTNTRVGTEFEFLKPCNSNGIVLNKLEKNKINEIIDKKLKFSEGLENYREVIKSSLIITTELLLTHKYRARIFES